MLHFKSQSDAGLTLLEALVSLVIIASIATVATTSIRKPSDGLTLQKIASEVANKAAQKRDQAVSQNTITTLTVSDSICASETTLTFFANGMAKGDDICLTSGDDTLILRLDSVTGLLTTGPKNALQ